MSDTLIETSGSATIMKSIHKKITRKFLLLFLFVVIFAFFAWLIVDNLISIWRGYKNYKSNVAAKDAIKQVSDNDPRNPANDDEKYNNPIAPARRPKTSGDNSAIENTVNTIKSKYKPINDLLKKQSHGKGDIIDEKIMSAQYDDY